MKRIIAVYQITYANGVTQTKNLIAQASFYDVIKPLSFIADELDGLKRKREAAIIKSHLKKMYGEHYFTNDSPIFRAINTGMLQLPEIQGGTHSCKVVRVPE